MNKDNKPNYNNYKKYLIPIFIFILTFLPRLLSLGNTLTTDERLWLTRSTDFINAIVSSNWANTFQTAHPGVTTMWLSGLSLSLFYRNGMDFSSKLFIAGFPIALTVSVGIVLMYYLLRHIFGMRIAAVSAILIATDPFYIALSRVVHLDALLTTFMVLAALALIAYLNHREKSRLFFLACLFTGLALLTKLPSIFLIPYMVMITMIWYLRGPAHMKDRVQKNFSTIIKTLLGLFAISTVIFIILWPSMWVQPLGDISQLINGTESVTENPHGSGFYMGAVSDGNFGLSFYPVVLIMRLTPITLLFSGICILFLIVSLVKNRLNNENTNMLFIVFFVLLFGLQMTIALKKGDRYLLPVFPFVDILAAIGVIYSVNLLIKALAGYGHLKNSEVEHNMKAGLIIVTAVIVLVQAFALVMVHPYYLAYFNPLVFGGPSNAPNVLTIGWGEGMDQAARYLDGKADAAGLTVAAEYPGFEQYFVGRTVDMGNISNSDYVVFYISPTQRNWDLDAWKPYQNTTPEKIITINHIDYCWIYRSKNASL